MLAAAPAWADEYQDTAKPFSKAIAAITLSAGLEVGTAGVTAEAQAASDEARNLDSYNNGSEDS